MRLFKSGTFWLILISVVLISGLTIMTVFQGWPIWTLLAGIILSLSAALVFILFGFFRANRKADEILSFAKKQAAKNKESVFPDKKAQIESLEREFDAGVNRLKNSNIGGGRRGSAALYTLPWYMFIGPSGVGKTTAIMNSGLSFPGQQGGIKGLGGTKNCEWFFSTDAIIIDTAGRYISKSDDREEWTAFLDMLKKNRRNSPINGVIVGFGIDEILNGTPAELNEHANRIRTRIDELTERLGVKLPIYVLFTKCDQLNGFVDFFEDLTSKQREQVWGYTADAERLEEEMREPAVLFEREFGRLVSILTQQRAYQLNRPLNRAERKAVYIFPIEFAALKENLSLFFSTLFQYNPYVESPLFRGFYFSSGTQTGDAIDRVADAMAKYFGLNASHEGKKQSIKERSYFLKRLFSSVIIPDRHLVTQTRSGALSGFIRNAGILTGAAAVLLLFVVLGILGLRQAERGVASYQNAGMKLNEMLLDPREISVDLDAFEVAHAQWANVEHPTLPRLIGLYSAGDFEDSFEQAYFQRLRTYVDRIPFTELKALLQNRDPARALRNVNYRAELEKYVGVFLLLTRDAGTFASDSSSTQFLAGELTKLARLRLERVSGRALIAPERNALHQSMIDYTMGIAAGTILPFDEDAYLVNNVCQLVAERPSIDGIYNRLRETGLARVDSLTIRTMSDGRNARISASYAVPWFYTKEAWRNFVDREIESMSEDPGRSNYCPSQDNVALSPALTDRNTVRKELEQRYFQEYTREWDRMLNAVSLRSYEGLWDIVAALDELGNTQTSPIKKLLERIVAETRFEEEGTISDIRRQAEGAANDALDRVPGVNSGDHALFEEHQVDLHFKWLHDLVGDPYDNAPKAIDDALRQFEDLGEVLDEIYNDPLAIHRFAADVLRSRGAELNRYEGGLKGALGTVRADEFVDNLFLSIIDRVWDAVLIDVQRYLDDEWRRRVYMQYDDLKSLYPFDPEGVRDVPIERFNDIFEPQTGIIVSFRKEFLGDFLDATTNRPRTWKGQGIRISSRFQSFLSFSDKLNGALYESGRLGLSFGMRYDNIQQSGDFQFTGSSLNINGAFKSWGTGYNRENQQFLWPGGGQSIAELSIRSSGVSPEPKRYMNPWAFFRLLDAAEDVMPGFPLMVRWSFGGEHMDYRGNIFFELSPSGADVPYLERSSFFVFGEWPETIG